MMIGRQLAVLGLIALAHGAEGLGNAQKHWAFQRFQKELPPKVKQASGHEIKSTGSWVRVYQKK